MLSGAGMRHRLWTKSVITAPGAILYSRSFLESNQARILTDNATWRHARYVQKPIESKQFEIMCQQIFGELYHCPGPRLFGRHGQGQSGLDILFHDFRTAPVDKGRGMVFVQCKYTEKQDLGITSLTEDILSASALVETSPGYAGVYLFIVATNARNSTALHTAVQNLKVEKQLPFEIEVHTWDRLCQTVLDNDRLWELFNESPEGRLPIRYRSRAHLLAECIDDHRVSGRLEDAKREDQHRRGSNFVPAFQMGQGLILPDEICFQSPPLRKALLALYTAGADAHAALAFRQYEFDLDNMQNAQSCLDYLRSERIVGHLRAPGRTFLFVGEAPRFAALLGHLVDVICKVQGSPDCLGALALMLVMESQDAAVQDRGLMMMQARARQDEGTQWERESRIAHAVVRYYHVLRQGWSTLSCKHALGDQTAHHQADGKWGEPFATDEHAPPLLAGGDPLVVPPSSGSHALNLIRDLGEYTQGNYEEAWPNLLAECNLYSATEHEHDSTHWPRSSPQLPSSSRVADFETLAAAVNKGCHSQLLERYSLMVTQRTFERLLGYRAFLRAFVERTQEESGKFADRLNAVERLIGSSEMHTTQRDPRTWETGRLWVATVYDNVPLQLSELPEGANYFNHFTLSREDFYWQRSVVDSWGEDERWQSLQRQYEQRNDDFGLACLLALHLSKPLLTYQRENAEHASYMGIAAIHPDHDNMRSYM